MTFDWNAERRRIEAMEAKLYRADARDTSCPPKQRARLRREMGDDYLRWVDRVLATVRGDVIGAPTDTTEVQGPNGETVRVATFIAAQLDEARELGIESRAAPGFATIAGPDGATVQVPRWIANTLADYDRHKAESMDADDLAVLRHLARSGYGGASEDQIVADYMKRSGFDAFDPDAAELAYLKRCGY